MLGLRDVSQYRRWDENWLADEVGTALFPHHGLRTHSERFGSAYSELPIIWCV
jgi:hypothetical protein